MSGEIKYSLWTRVRTINLDYGFDGGDWDNTKFHPLKQICLFVPWKREQLYHIISYLDDIMTGL